MKKKLIIPKKEGLEQILNGVMGLGIDVSCVEMVAEAINFAGNFTQKMERHFQRYGLSQPGFLVILILYSDNQEEWTVVKLADSIGVKAPTMTGILDTLERQDYIKRIPFPNDRRKIMISLTNNGKKRFADILPDHFARLRIAFGGLNKPKDNKIRSGILRTLGDAADTLSQDTEEIV
jgi:DNA-binding MarR family transcriptional regulator